MAQVLKSNLTYYLSRFCYSNSRYLLVSSKIRLNFRFVSKNWASQKYQITCQFFNLRIVANIRNFYKKSKTISDGQILKISSLRTAFHAQIKFLVLLKCLEAQYEIIWNHKIKIKKVTWNSDWWRRWWWRQWLRWRQRHWWQNHRLLLSSTTASTHLYLFCSFKVYFVSS